MNKDGRPQPVRVLLQLQTIWRLAIPIWIFRDASNGSSEQCIANYRYNRARRKVLPFYIWKWMGISICMMQLTRLLSEQMSDMPAHSSAHLLATLACMSAGIGFAFSCVVISVLFFSYLYLSCVKR